MMNRWWPMGLSRPHAPDPGIRGNGRQSFFYRLPCIPPLPGRRFLYNIKSVGGPEVRIYPN
jgi:hypothetical protein